MRKIWVKQGYLGVKELISMIMCVVDRFTFCTSIRPDLDD